MPTDAAVRPTIFLSYSHADRATAQRLTAALEQSGYTIWWDALIEGGSRFAKSIDEALQKADAVLVLWSEQSIESDWVRDEAAQGRDRHRLVPVSIDGTRPPLGFRQIQVIDLSGWRGRADAPQIDAIRRAIAVALGAKPAPRSIASAPVTRRRAIAAGAGGAALLAGGGLIAWRSGLFGASGAQARSLAVLPFKNVGGDPAQAYLADGLTEEIRSALARNPGLLVLAATTSNTVRDHGGGARAIAAELGVAYLLDGSVQRSADRVRVATNLTDGKTGFSEWSQRVERQLSDVFAFQSEIARNVSDALSARMATDASAPGGTRNARAYEAYLRGKALYNLSKDEATDRQARANFEIAISADPDFALAHAALSRVLSSLAAQTADTSQLRPLFKEAVAEAERSIQLAPTLAPGHLALGYARFAGFFDMRGARPSYDKAYQYGRGDADIGLLYAVYCLRARRFAEARDAIERALALDPLNPRTHRAAGTIAYASRRYPDAVAQYRRALELNPTMSNAYAFLALSLLELGRVDEARAAAARETRPMFGHTARAIIEYRAGDRAAAQRAFDALVADAGDSALYQQAQVMAQWGKVDLAIDFLQKARALGDSGMTAIASDPLLDPIARDPRYRAMVRDLAFA